jgi:hypothetical protein
MSLEKLKINPYNIGLLYNEGLVASKETNSNELKINVLGNNEQHIALLVFEPNVPIISDAHLEFINKLLLACKLNMDQVAIVNLAANYLTIGAINSTLQPKLVLMFGVSSTQLGLPIVFPDHKVQLHDNVKYIRTKDIASLQFDVTAKTEFWAALKVGLGIS